MKNQFPPTQVADEIFGETDAISLKVMLVSVGSVTEIFGFFAKSSNMSWRVIDGSTSRRIKVALFAFTSGMIDSFALPTPRMEDLFAAYQ